MTAGTNDFSHHRPGLSSPYENAAAVTPHDTNELANYSRALYIGVAGDVVVTTVNGNTVTFKAVPVGILPVRAKIVQNTSTTATNILCLW